MKFEKIGKLVTNLHDKTEYVIHKRNLKQGLICGSVLKKVYKVIKFNQNAWLKPYIDMNTKLRKKAKNNLEKDFFKLMNNAVLGKNYGKCENSKIVTAERRRIYLLSEPKFHHSQVQLHNK